jgi:putative transposase
VHITPWKKVALEELPKIFSSRRGTKQQDEDALKAALYQQVGQLKVALDGLKKKLAVPMEEKRAWMEPGHPQLSLRRPWALLGLARSSVDYRPVQARAEDLHRMRLIDEPSTATPLDGMRRMTAWLRNQGDAVKHTHGRRLMRQLGLAAIDAKPRLSQPVEGHQVSPYRWRGGPITRAHPVWSADITYVRLQAGCVSLVAVRDWFRRYVWSWAVSITLDVPFCLEALEQALAWGQPPIFNTDQGAPFTSRAFTARLQHGGVQISMAGRGRALDHVFVERWWRTVKDEEVSLRD